MYNALNHRHTGNGEVLSSFRYFGGRNLETLLDISSFKKAEERKLVIMWL